MYTEEEERAFIQADYINVQKQNEADKEYGIKYGMFLEDKGDNYLKYLTKKLSQGTKYGRFIENVLNKRLENLKRKMGTEVYKYGARIFNKDTNQSILSLIVIFLVLLAPIFILGLGITHLILATFVLTYIINFKSVNKYKVLETNSAELIYTLFQTLIFPIKILTIRYKKNKKLLSEDFKSKNDYKLRGKDELIIFNKLRAIYVLRGFTRHKVKVLPTNNKWVEELIFQLMGTDRVRLEDVNYEFDRLLEGLNTPIEINTTQSIGYMTYLYKLLIVNKDLGIRLSTNNFKVNKEIEDLELKKELIEESELTADSLFELITQLELDKNLIEETSYLSKSIKELEESEELRQKKLGYIRKYRNEYEISKEDAKLLLGDKQREKLVKGIKQESQTKLKEISNKLDKINSKL